MFTNEDVAEYYDSTQNHYEKWWGLKDHRALHYGIWDKGIRSFGEAVANTNRLMLQIAKIEAHHHVLDAGCGVGGSSFFIHKEIGASVHGITLSGKQLDTARQTANDLSLKNEQVKFSIMDFTRTDFSDQSFDVIWACESVCHTPDKADFLSESMRLLKPGGRIIICDFYATPKGLEDDKRYMRRWMDSWGIDNYATLDQMTRELDMLGFSSEVVDYTAQIWPSAWRLYLAACIGSVGSELYNLFHPGVSRFARSHYKCGIYQYKALRAGLWRYAMICATKP